MPIPEWLLYSLAGAGALAVVLVIGFIALLVFILVLARMEIARKERREKLQIEAALHGFAVSSTPKAATASGVSVDTPAKATSSTPPATSTAPVSTA